MVDVQMSLIEQTVTILTGLLAISLVLERAFHFIFHFGLCRALFQRQNVWVKSLKALIVFSISFWTCIIYNIDAVARIVDSANISSILGISITALVIAGGSAGIRRMMFFIRTLSDARINLTHPPKTGPCDKS